MSSHSIATKDSFIAHIFATAADARTHTASIKQLAHVVLNVLHECILQRCDAFAIALSMSTEYCFSKRSVLAARPAAASQVMVALHVRTLPIKRAATQQRAAVIRPTLVCISA